MFQVFDGNKPADCHHHNIHKSWDKSLFDSYEEAEKYALNWLGIYGPGKGVLKPNVPHNFSCFEDAIYLEIREVK